VYGRTSVASEQLISTPLFRVTTNCSNLFLAVFATVIGKAMLNGAFPDSFPFVLKCARMASGHFDGSAPKSFPSVFADIDGSL